MASFNKLLDWVGPLVFIGGVAYLWYAFTRKAWPFDQILPPMMQQPSMMMMPSDAVPVEELSRIPITALPGDNMVTPLVSTGLSPVLVPAIPSTTAMNVLGMTAPMPGGVRQQNVITKTSTGNNQVVMASNMKQVNIGGTGATNQKTSAIPPIPGKPPVPVPVIMPPRVPVTQPRPPTIPMINLPKLPSIPGFTFPTFPTITYTPMVRF